MKVINFVNCPCMSKANKESAIQHSYEKKLLNNEVTSKGRSEKLLNMT